jgi:GNAT superfamily N-acetyltransferase
MSPSTPAPSVRTATLDDLPGLIASSTALFAEDGGTRDATMNTDWPQQHGADAFTASLADPSRLVLVAVAGDGAIVGHLSGQVSPPDDITLVNVATLTAMQVNATHRGSGHGSALVDAFLSWATDQGATQARVTAYAANDGARRFYRRHGFADFTVTHARPLPATH